MSLRDITDPITYQLKLKESALLYKPLFELNPDMILLQDKEGIIIDVNPALLTYYNQEKQNLVNRRLSDFLPPEKLAICEESLQKALKGNQESFTVDIGPNEIGMGHRVFDIKKIPVIVDQEVVGVYSIMKDITEITTSFEKIQEQAKRLHTIFESITDAFFTLDRDWNFTYINKEFDRILYTKREELLGKNIWEAFPEEVTKTFYQQYHYAVQSGIAVHFESYFQRLDVWLEVKAFPSVEGLSVYFSDVTEKIKAKLELEKLSLVASKTINGVIITDVKGLTEWVNDGFTHLTGYTLSEVAGDYMSSYLIGPETDEATSRRIEEKMSQRIPSIDEILIYKKSGEKLWILLEITPIHDDSGELIRFIGIQTDITFRKEAEEAQLKLTNDLSRQNRDLQQFAYIVSHNLRAPVANALGYADLLTKADKNSELHDLSLTNLRTSINRLDAILKDLSLILSIRDNKGVAEKEKVDIRKVCQLAINNLQESLQACGGQVFLMMEEEIYLRGYKAYFYSIFYNLLTNAIKYRSPDRALKIHIKCLGNPQQGVTISFSDNGLGFDRKKVGDHIFKLYKRFHNNVEGRGIGLFLVKSHVEAMAGHIEVTSQVDKGTTFLIYLK